MWFVGKLLYICFININTNLALEVREREKRKQLGKFNLVEVFVECYCLSCPLFPIRPFFCSSLLLSHFHFRFLSSTFNFFIHYSNSFLIEIFPTESVIPLFRSLIYFHKHWMTSPNFAHHGNTCKIFSKKRFMEQYHFRHIINLIFNLEYRFLIDSNKER